jgi:dTDP-4-dehydrorhamnose 3,5-epimerase
MENRWIPDIPQLVFQKNVAHLDDRGTFAKFLDLNATPLDEVFSNIAISKNPTAGTLRGLHFQDSSFAEEKAIMCVRGSIFEVFVDLRRDLSSYGQWTHRIMTSSNLATVFVPKGIAHGFQTLEEDTWVLYGLTSVFSKEHAHRISYLDPTLAIEWPLPVTAISDADANGLTWNDCEKQKFVFKKDIEIK